MIGGFRLFGCRIPQVLYRALKLVIDPLLQSVNIPEVNPIDPIDIRDEFGLGRGKPFVQELVRLCERFGIALHRLDSLGLLVNGKLVRGVLLLKNGDFSKGDAAVYREAGRCRYEQQD
ncbi:hypothetical protein [Sinorhizobium sojae]|uniref:hypothetical protein n=1 Tax=Sinorhizobium sojae TaxID=716925 RepID=UPI0012FA3D5A|nr:hypothetical protein [Sinorhizobium sojae]